MTRTKTIRKPSARSRTRYPGSRDIPQLATRPWRYLGQTVDMACGPNGFTTHAELARGCRVTERVLLAFIAGEVASPTDLPTRVCDALQGCPPGRFVPKDRQSEIDLGCAAICNEYRDRLEDEADAYTQLHHAVFAQFTRSARKGAA